MVLILGQANNAKEFQEHIYWTQWNGERLWNEISSVMGWKVLLNNQPPRVIEANWIPVSNFVFSL